MLKGVILIFLAQVFWVFQLFFLKKYLTQINPLVINAFQVFFAFLIFIPLLFYFLFSGNISKLITDSKIFWIGVSGILWIILGETFFLFGLFKLPISLASFIALIYPLLATILGVLFLKEVIDLYFILGAILIILGFVLLIFK